MHALLHFLPPWLLERCRVHDAAPKLATSPKAIVYWMRVAVRDHENPALDVARALALNLGVPFMIVHALSERYPYASDRHHTFILEGARDVQAAFHAQGIPYAFHLEHGVRRPVLKQLADQGCLFVTELMPTAPLRGWTESLAQYAPVVEVDASCIFPMPTGLTHAPTRAFEFRKHAAPHTASRAAEGYPPLQVGGELTPLTELPFEPIQFEHTSIRDLVARCAIDHGVGPVPDSLGGMHAGYARWKQYLETQLHSYARTRNHPLADSTSRMSAYLHYGHVSPFRLAHDLHTRRSADPSAEKLLDELLIWRELAWHHAYHDASHTNYASIPAWARDTLEVHERDARASLPSLERLTRGEPMTYSGMRVSDRCWPMVSYTTMYA